MGEGISAAADSAMKVALFAVACLLASAAQTESHGILESIQDIVGVDLGEAYARPFSDNHPLMDIMAGAAKPKTKLPTLAEALEEGMSAPRDVPSPFEETRPVPISKIVRHVATNAKRLSIPKLLAARHGRETSPFHMALKSATRRVKHARKARWKLKKKIRALSTVSKVLASPMSMPLPRHTTKKVKKKTVKLLRKHPSTKALLKALQNGISGVKKAERSVVKTAKIGHDDDRGPDQPTAQSGPPTMAEIQAKCPTQVAACNCNDELAAMIAAGGAQPSSEPSAALQAIFACFSANVAVTSLKKGSSDAYKKLLDRVKKP